MKQLCLAVIALSFSCRGKAADLVEKKQAPLVVTPVKNAVPPAMDAPRPSKIEPPAGRILHPIGGPNCQEMYTACTRVEGKGEQCTSASFGIQCGETQRLPATGELLSCVCP